MVSIKQGIKMAGSHCSGLLLSMLLPISVFLLLSGCSWWCSFCEPPDQQAQAANRNPRITALYAEFEGNRVRWVVPGTTVTLRAVAKDPDGDALVFRWEVAPGSGQLVAQSGIGASWMVSDEEKICTLQLIVTDGYGGLAKKDVHLSTGPKPRFAGRFRSVSGDPVPSVEVELNGQRSVADQNGMFEITLENANAPRFLFNARKAGYGLISLIYDHVITDGRWVLTPATVQIIDPTRANIVRDLASQANCQGPQSAKVKWPLFPRQSVPRAFDRDGAEVGGFPAPLREAVEFILNDTECSPGIRLRIPANSLVNAQGTAPSGNVQVALATVDIFAPDALAGDFTVLNKEGMGAMPLFARVTAETVRGSTAVMQSYGAGTVTVSDTGQEYQLRPGRVAELTIPVDPAQLKRPESIPPTIPLLLYNTSSGVWTRVGTARLNAAGDAYVAPVSHFSEFNMDLIKTDQSCVRVDAGALSGDFEMDVVVPMGSASPVVRHKTISENPEQPEPRLHALYNLPSNAWIGLIPMHDVGGALVPYGIFGVNTGPPQVPTDPNRPDYPYDACQSEIVLSDMGGITSLEVDGTDDFDQLPPLHIYDLVDAGGTDIYPVGAGEYYLFGLFDTGSNIVLINNLDAGVLNMGVSSAGNVNQDVDVRINGLGAVDPATLLAPIYEPGMPSGAQAEVPGIRVGIRELGASLIGTPVANQVVAFIDQTTTVSRGPYPFCGGCSFEGPDITIFAPGDPAIPRAQLALELERFGDAGTSGPDNATKAQRYLLRNVEFRDGINIVNDDPSAAEPRHFSFDTGTKTLIISSDMATTLGIDTGAPDSPDGFFEECWSDAGHPGNELYRIDALTITNPDGSFYRVNNLPVCVDKLDDKIITYISAGDRVDAVFGMNAFMQVPVIFNGPDNTLGIGIAAP